MVGLMNALTQAFVNALAAVAARTSTLTGSAFNTTDYDGLGLLVLHGVRTTGDLTPTIEESDASGSGYATIGTDKFGGFTAITSGTDFLQFGIINLAAAKQFIRFIGTATNTPNHTYGCSLIAFKKVK